MYSENSLWLTDIPIRLAKRYDADVARWDIVSLPALLAMIVAISLLVNILFLPDIFIEEGWGVPWAEDPLLPHKTVALIVFLFSSAWLQIHRCSVEFDDREKKMRYRTGLGRWTEHKYQGIGIEQIMYRPFWRLRIYSCWAHLPDGRSLLVYTTFRGDEMYKLVTLDLARRVARIKPEELGKI